MTKKSMVQVVIGGKVLTMGGYDDETHIQRIASCVNRVMRRWKMRTNIVAFRLI